PHARVAPQAVLRRRHVDGRRHRVRDVGMTGHARPDRNLAVAWRDDDGIGEVTGGEGERVVPAVDGFRDVLANRVVRRVAVVTDGDGAMTAAHPARVLLVHDVAVRACGGVVGEVGRTPGVDEGVAADTGKDAGGNPEDHGYTHRHPADTVAEVGLSLQALVDGVPVDDVPPGREVVGALVLVLQVVGVLPDVDADDGRLAFHDR